MGAFSTKKPIVIGETQEDRKQLGWEDHESITIKGAGTTEDIDAISAADKTGNSTQVMLERFVLSWTLINNDKMPVDVSPLSLAVLQTPYVVPVVGCIGEVMGTSMTQEQMQAFLKRATAPSSAR